MSNLKSKIKIKINYSEHKKDNTDCDRQFIALTDFGWMNVPAQQIF